MRESNISINFSSWVISKFSWCFVGAKKTPHYSCQTTLIFPTHAPQMVLNPPLKSTGAGRWQKETELLSQAHFPMVAYKKHWRCFLEKELLRMWQNIQRRLLKEMPIYFWRHHDSSQTSRYTEKSELSLVNFPVGPCPCHVLPLPHLRVTFASSCCLGFLDCFGSGFFLPDYACPIMLFSLDLVLTKNCTSTQTYCSEKRTLCSLYGFKMCRFCSLDFISFSVSSSWTTLLFALTALPNLQRKAPLQPNP